MKLPSFIMVRGEKWVVRVEELPLDDDANPVSGFADGSKKEIVLDQELKGNDLIEVFFHEYAHALAFEVGIDDEGVPTWIEHMLVVGLGKDFVHNRKKFRDVLED